MSGTVRTLQLQFHSSSSFSLIIKTAFGWKTCLPGYTVAQTRWETRHYAALTRPHSDPLCSICCSRDLFNTSRHCAGVTGATPGGYEINGIIRLMRNVLRRFELEVLKILSSVYLIYSFISAWIWLFGSECGWLITVQLFTAPADKNGQCRYNDSTALRHGKAIQQVRSHTAGKSAHQNATNYKYK